MRRSLRTRRRKNGGVSGMGLADVMIATLIMFTGALAMIDALPRLLNIANTFVSDSSAYVVGAAKIDELLVADYSTISSGSGDFSTLLPGATENDGFTWSYTSTEPIAGIMKKVTVVVIWGSTWGDTEAFSFYRTDMDNEEI